MTIRTLVVLLAVLASPARALDLEEARHLASRTGFGLTPAEWAVLEPLDREQAVDRVLAGVRRIAREPLADSASPAPPRRPGTSEAARRAVFREQQDSAIQIKAWWYREMLGTDTPFTERMTLFWHNHLTTETRKVKWPALVHDQNRLLRRHALGSFRTLLHEIVRDPAMLRYLDGAASRKEHPNENFARELLELFTLGEGHYTEQDIREAARAFTGWRLRRDGSAHFRARWHDDGRKTFLGRTGRFDGDDIVEIILDQHRTAIFVTEKLWRELVSPDPEADEVRRLAEIFRGNGYEIRPLVRAMLTSEAFWAPENRFTLVRSPVELMVGTARLLPDPRLSRRELLGFVRAGRLLGQDVLDPPNVKGWAGGSAWITTSSLVARRNLLDRWVDLRFQRSGDQEGAMGGGRRAARIRGMGGASKPTRTRPVPTDLELVERILATRPTVEPPPEGVELAEIVTHRLLDPSFQLK